jgi:hypothetical protein
MINPLPLGDKLPIPEEDSMDTGHGFCSESSMDPCTDLLDT